MEASTKTESKQVRLTLESMTCNKTTEAGADEVFIMVSARRSDGVTSLTRLPGDGRHWDMNDGDQPTDNPNGDSHTITNRPLFAGDLLPGQSYDLAVTVMEEDGANTARAQELLAAKLASTGNPFALAGAGIISLATALGIHVDDSDDVPGAFSVHIVNDGGKVAGSFAGIDRVAAEEAPSDSRHGFRFNGDGSTYSATFALTAR
jgi:hypothetical protein